MNKIWIVTGTEYQTNVEKYHTRAVLIPRGENTATSISGR